MTKRTLTQILIGTIIIVAVTVCVSLSKCHNSTKTENDGFPTSSTTIGAVSKSYEKEGVTHVTIGQGNIEIADGSDISNINRDINNVQEITKDQITGALDAEVTIDNRMFTESGREEIVDDIKNTPENIIQVAKDISALSEQIKETAVNAYKNITNNHPDFIPENVLQISGSELQSLLEKGILVPIEEEEEEEEKKFNQKQDIVAISGKERKFIQGQDGQIYDVTDDYIESTYPDMAIIALYFGGKVVEYVATPSTMVKLLERFGNNVSSSQRIQGILKPDGKLIGAVKGTDKSIRTVSKDKFDDVVNQLQEIKVKPIDKPNYKGQWYEAVDGKGGFGIRNSDKNGTTIDLNFPDVSNKAIKIHYKP